MIENLSSTLMWQKYKRNHAQPRERFELSTPGLQDQCSNHWANEAATCDNARISHYLQPWGKRWRGLEELDVIPEKSLDDD